MDRRTFAISALAFTVFRHLHAQQVTELSSVSRQDDIDAVYSLVLSGLCKCCHDRRDKWLIDAWTYSPALPIVSAKSFTPLERARLMERASSFITPPNDHLEDAVQLVADLRSQVASPRAINARLKLSRPYRLITADENRLYFTLQPQGNVYNIEDQARPATVSADSRRRFEHVSGIDSLSPVGFNATRTLALFSYRRVGGSCVEESWHVLEKANHRWRILDWQSFGESGCS